MNTVIVLGTLSFILSVLLSISVYFNVKHGVILLNMQDSIEESLDVLDEKYQSISKVVEIPVFFDSLEVRQVISDIENCRDSILYVANQLSATNTTEDSLENEKEN
tara:strand:+ start:159 stop:476 length:318 start_codon:yes stop_codon:yes gene_type:complete